MLKLSVVSVLLVGILVGCGSQAAAPTVVTTPVPTETTAPAPTEMTTPVPTIDVLPPEILWGLELDQVQDVLMEFDSVRYSFGDSTFHIAEFVNASQADYNKVVSPDGEVTYDWEGGVFNKYSPERERFDTPPFEIEGLGYYELYNPMSLMEVLHKEIESVEVTTLGGEYLISLVSEEDTGYYLPPGKYEINVSVSPSAKQITSTEIVIDGERTVTSDWEYGAELER